MLCALPHSCLHSQCCLHPLISINSPPPLFWLPPRNGSCGKLRLSPQVGKSGHSSVEDARATMELYKVVEEEWEQHLRQNLEQE